MMNLGPVSAWLETDLRRSVRERSVVVWLDLDGHYTDFVDQLVAAREAGELPYTVRAFRGSYLALMIALEGVAGGVDGAPLVLHLPGFNEESVKRSPALELYAAGKRYRRALDTLVTEAAAGRVQAEAIAAFVAQPGLTLAGADAWLAALLADTEGGLAGQLRAMQPAAVLDDLLTGGYVAGRIGQGADEDALWERLAAWTGLSVAWRETVLPAAQARAGDVAFAAASWALCVEYVDDLKREPVNEHLTGVRALPRGVIDTCRKIAVHLRERHAPFYKRTADDTERALDDEVKRAQAEDLGRVDTFRFEEDKVLKAALAKLGEGAWDQAAAWAEMRVEAKPGAASFWLKEDPTRQSAWQLVHGAARLGQAVVRAGARLVGGVGLEGAVEAYVARGAAVDQAHRHLEQRRVALLYPQLPEFDALRARLDDARTLWRGWADGWARDFNALCRTGGFLPEAAWQQRTLFDEVVRPMAAESGTTAYFVVDALRYEMGEELYRHLADTPATAVQLKARLAELPTVTEVGMNVLAPVARHGRLTLELDNGGAKVSGFSTGEFRVKDPESRRRAMHDRVGGATCPWLSLEEVVGRDGASLKRSIAQAKLVVVHSREIDNAGEKGVGPAVFDHVMQKLRAAWRLLRDAGVKRFVITSDHGFLLLDDGSGVAQAHGRVIDPKRRHVFSPVAADHTGEVRVALADLGYDGAAGNLMFPDSTAVFNIGKRDTSFVHGGNSLQERVIPVLTLVHRAAAGGSTQEFGVTAAAREGVAGMHCVEVLVEAVAQGTLDFSAPKALEIGLRVPDVEGVQVELCQTRGGSAQIVGGAVAAPVGASFELFFRLSGVADARVLVELYHPSAVARVQACVPDARFAVLATGTKTGGDAGAVMAPEGGLGWLALLPEGGERRVFQHLSAHGTVTEGEMVEMLGGPRSARKFALHFEALANKAPFRVRIETVGGVKRYVREGGGA